MTTDNAAQRQAAEPSASPQGTAVEQPRAWHVLSAEEVARAIQTNPTTGLSRAEVTRWKRQYGPNALPETRRCELLGRTILHSLHSFSYTITAPKIARWSS
jgi:magnesium-transporting ATPase (P-type)